MITLTFASDYRFSQTLLNNDIGWFLDLEAQAAHAPALFSAQMNDQEIGVAYKLRGQPAVRTTAQYQAAPVAREAYSNLVTDESQPYAEIAVTRTHIFGSRSVYLRISVKNVSTSEQTLALFPYTRLQYSAAQVNQLNLNATEYPQGVGLEGNPERQWGTGASTILFLRKPAGQFQVSELAEFSAAVEQEALTNTLILIAPAQGGVYASVQQTLTLAPDAEEVLECLVHVDADHTVAAQTAQTVLSAYDFAGTLTAIRNGDAQVVKATTGDADLDELFRLRNQLLFQTVVRAEQDLAHLSFIFIRGSSRAPVWTQRGQHAHEAMSFLALLPSHPEILRDVLHNFFEKQQTNGLIPYKISRDPAITTNMINNKIATLPVLAHLTWQYYRYTNDLAFLRLAYPYLKRFNAYLRANRDRNRNGLYEWYGAGPLEHGGELESVRDGQNVVGELIRHTYSGLGFKDVEGPDLQGFLYRDLVTLAKIAQTLRLPADGRTFVALADTLKRRTMAQLWDAQRGTFVYKYIDTRKSSRPLQPIQDYGMLVPAWAGMLSQTQANLFIRNHLLNPDAFWRANGIPSLAANTPQISGTTAFNPKGHTSSWNGPVWGAWNLIALEALLRYGFKQEAVELMRRFSAAQKSLLETGNHLWECHGPDDLADNTCLKDYNFAAAMNYGYYLLQQAGAAQYQFSKPIPATYDPT